MMMTPNNDITNNSHTCNKDMDDGIISTTTTSDTCDEWRLYWDNLNKYTTRITTTTKVSNVCGGGGNDGSSTSSSVITYLFASHYYEKPHLAYFYFCLFIVIII